MRAWDRFVAIDWSGAKGKRHSAIQIACCVPGRAAPTLVPRDRSWTRPEVKQWLAEIVASDERVLVGIDASLGLPMTEGSYFPGAAQSPQDARALWAEIASHLSDDEEGGNPYIAHRRPWFWGLNDGLKKDRARLRRCESRYIDQRFGTPESCFVMIGPKQVAKSSLTAMAMLADINGLCVWPFDTLSERGPVLVEIYCQTFAKMTGANGKLRTIGALNSALTHRAIASDPVMGNPLDKIADHKSDAIISAAGLRAIAKDPNWWHPDGLDAVAQAEGWTFGVA